MQKINSKDLFVVAIGASAGGIEALKEMLGVINPNCHIAYVLVMHMAPDIPNGLTEVIQSFSNIPVLEVKKDIKVEHGKIYVISPGQNLTYLDGFLRVSKIENELLKRKPIDHLFESLATNISSKCVGVILSGTGSDGSYGLKKINNSGGLVVVQEPKEAKFDGMPSNAIETGQVDHVISASKIIEFIEDYTNNAVRNNLTEPEMLEPSDREVLKDILEYIRGQQQIDFSGYKQSTILRRIHRRMQFNHKTTLTEYLVFLRSKLNEASLLVNECLITVTQFFRDKDVFDNISRIIIPAVFEDKNTDDAIRVWSVGCASGEEAYSMAILLLEEANRRPISPKIEIFASDISEPALKRAREGVFSGAIEAELSNERLQRYFIKENEGYRVRKELRELIVFANHNILRDPPFSKLDIIICRNLLIYLNRNLQNDVIDLFHCVLNPNGILILGPSETIEREALFNKISADYCIYKRLNVPAPEPKLPVFPQINKRFNSAFSSGNKSTNYGLIHQKYLEKYSLPSILIDQDFRVVHASDNSGRYLLIQGGELSSSVFKLIREELRLELRAALYNAKDHIGPIKSQPALIVLDGEEREVTLRIEASSDAEYGGFTLILFDEFVPLYAHKNLLEPIDEDELQQINLIKERLRRAIHQHETAEEEMRVSNEELQSVNEELRSTMEELETSKEELQSMNEELQTSNQENQYRMEELHNLTNDLQNLMASTDIGTIFLDLDLRIVRSTPPAEVIFNIRPSDEGRPITELSNRLQDFDFKSDLHQVLKGGKIIERQVRTDSNSWILLRFLPYLVEKQDIAGIVITFVDITSLKQNEKLLIETRDDLKHQREQLEWIYSNAPIGMCFLDLNLHFIKINQYMADVYGRPHEAFFGKSIIDIIPEFSSAIEKVTAEIKSTHKPASIILHNKQKESNNHKYAKIYNEIWYPVYDNDKMLCGFSSLVEEITDQEIRTNLIAKDKARNEFLAVLAHELRNPISAINNALLLLSMPNNNDPKLIGENTDAIAVSLRQINHLKKIVDELMELSRFNSGKISLQLAPCDLRHVMTSSIELVEKKISDKMQKLSLNICNEDLVIFGDFTRLVQIFSNLIDNASKYSPDNSEIEININRINGHVQATVKDCGIGIEKDHLNSIFDMFNQVDSYSRASTSSGLGLGLALTKKLVLLHRGLIVASSDGLGKGSEFFVQLPIDFPKEIALRSGN